MNVRGKRVLAVGAHPDDVEIICAGTLLCLREKGCEIHVATLTLGDCGSADEGRDEIRRVRRREAETACARIGAVYHSGAFDDFSIFVDDPSTRRVTALLRDVDPFVVITHPPHDYLLDHENASLLVRNACFIAPAPNYDTGGFGSARPTSRIPYLYYAHPVEGIDIVGRRVTPQFYVDIASVFEAKLDMLSCHESQRAWLRAHHGIDEYLGAVSRWCEELGRRASMVAGTSVRYAEAYRQHLGHSYPNDNVLSPLLGTRVIREPEWGKAAVAG